MVKIKHDNESFSTVMIKPSFEIKRLSNRQEDFITALHRVFDFPPPQPHTQPHPHISQLLENASVDHAEPHARNTLYLYGAYADQELISVSLAIDSHGSSAMVFISGRRHTEIVQEGTVYALRSLLTEAWERNLSLVETLLLPGSNETAHIVEQAGFRYLTRLLYLRRRQSIKKQPSCMANDLEWVVYTHESDDLFRRTVELTYAQSLDCPELTRLRSVEDVLAGHRTVGEHDPSLWWVAIRSGKPAGVMLLSRISARSALEIVYMGVTQDARGTGVADAMLERAVQKTGKIQVRELALAVDRRNDPARRMYARWGFVEFGTRDAWIVSPSPIRV